MALGFMKSCGMGAAGKSMTDQNRIGLILIQKPVSFICYRYRAESPPRIEFDKIISCIGKIKISGFNDADAFFILYLQPPEKLFIRFIFDSLNA